MARLVLLVLVLGLTAPVGGALGNLATLSSMTPAGALVRVYQDDFEGDSLSPDWEIWPDGPQTVSVSDGELHLDPDASGTAFPWVWTGGWGDEAWGVGRGPVWGVGRPMNGEPPLAPYRVEFAFTFGPPGTGGILVADSAVCQVGQSKGGMTLTLFLGSPLQQSAHRAVSTDPHVMACGWTGYDFYLELDGAVRLRGIPVPDGRFFTPTPPLGDQPFAFGGWGGPGDTYGSLFVDRVTLFVGETVADDQLEAQVCRIVPLGGGGGCAPAPSTNPVNCQPQCVPAPIPTPAQVCHLNPFGGGGGCAGAPPVQREDARCIVNLADPTNPSGGCIDRPRPNAH